MSTPFRSAFAVLMIGIALAAAAVAPAHSTQGGADDFVGTWITWESAPQGGRAECRRLYVSAEGADGAATRGGTWDAPGWKGLVSGFVVRAAEGPAWSGEWRDGQIAGTFHFVLRGADSLEGTFAAPGAGSAPQRWTGRRETRDGTPRVPCTFSR